MERSIEYLPIDDVTADERNPKRHDIALLGASMRRFGYVEPIVIDERTGRLISGHGRVETVRGAQARGDDAPDGVEVNLTGDWLVPVVRGWASADDDEAAAALIALNRSTEVGGWSDEGLYELLDHLSEQPAGLYGVGYGEDDVAVLQRFVEAVAGEEGRTDPYAEYHSMPSYDTDAQRPYRTIIVHLPDAEAVEAFGALEGVEFTADSRYIWFPPKVRERTTSVQFLSVVEE